MGLRKPVRFLFQALEVFLGLAVIVLCIPVIVVGVVWKLLKEVVDA